MRRASCRASCSTCSGGPLHHGRTPDGSKRVPRHALRLPRTPTRPAEIPAAPTPRGRALRPAREQTQTR
ncbi:hypothetical protein BV25DRAFT_1830645 [Artomyces pyxidatus]|uniref:Uncharacterized protein n=1 Tax=Artomyces pyxidatus TaxID=48021 RepID=A0ACB8SP72_9AGAM|nr:hypothetical protein BV25DRAFT_1830645 [Artomyces pyxidatus]